MLKFLFTQLHTLPALPVVYTVPCYLARPWSAFRSAFLVQLMGTCWYLGARDPSEGISLSFRGTAPGDCHRAPCHRLSITVISVAGWQQYCHRVLCYGDRHGWWLRQREGRFLKAANSALSNTHIYATLFELIYVTPLLLDLINHRLPSSTPSFLLSLCPGRCKHSTFL